MEAPPVVRFGPFAFDRARRVLLRDGRPVPIGGRGASLLAALADAGGETVSRADLLDAAWPGLAVEERNLTVQIAALRKAMGDPPEGLDPIRTVARMGYRLLCDGPAPAPILALRPTVIVLPFANLSPDPELGFFAQGVTEDVIAALSRFRTFAVVARGALPGVRDPAEAARAAGVAYVVAGSVRREGRRLRVGCRLTDADGAVLWADRWEDELGGVFEMQDRIAAAVVARVQPRIGRAEVERSRRKHPESLDAYDHFVQGMAFLDVPGATSAVRFDGMVHHLDRAAALDPGFPQALACAAWAHGMRRSMGGSIHPGTDDFAMALDLSDRAMALTGDDALVLAVGAVQGAYLRADDAGAAATVERALALSPHWHPVVDIAASIHTHGGRPDRALLLLEHCLRLAPSSPGEAMTLESIAVVHLVSGRFEEAVDWARRMRAVREGWNADSLVLAIACAMAGRLDEARAELDRILALRPGLTLRGVDEGRPPGPRDEGDRIWTEGLRRAGLPEG